MSLISTSTAGARFARITLVSVTGLPDAQGAANALALSLRNMPGAQALLCSPHAPANLHPEIRHCAIAPMSYLEYSLFVMLALWRLIETDFALLIQDDGWVLDGANWRDEYFDYDYIGALVNAAAVETPEGVRSTYHFDWCDYLDKPGHIVRYTINGGFSLRSKRMLRALIDHRDIRIEFLPPDDLTGNPLRMDWKISPMNEDIQLSCILRQKLEAVGMRYAPLEVCRQFAAEDTGRIYEGFDFTMLFGHHATWRRLVSIDPPTVRYPGTQAEIEHASREGDFARMLLARGYRVECKPS